MYDFIERFAPHLTKSMVDKATQCHGKQEMDELFKDINLPEH
jgi:LysR family transcriptional regulator, cys regulon transcriptional activator